jgi:hypothetical protein
VVHLFHLVLRNPHYSLENESSAFTTEPGGFPMLLEVNCLV